MGLVFTSVIYYVCYQGVVDAARMGMPGGLYFDVLVVTLVAHFVSTFSSYGWYIFLLVSGRGYILALLEQISDAKIATCSCTCVAVRQTYYIWQCEQPTTVL